MGKKLSFLRQFEPKEIEKMGAKVPKEMKLPTLKAASPQLKNDIIKGVSLKAPKFKKLKLALKK
jgi:hypothetical protein